MSKLAGTGGEEINHLREKDARCSFLFQAIWISYHSEAVMIEEQYGWDSVETDD